MGLVAAWSPNPVGAQAVPDPLTLATTVSAGHDAGVGCPGDESLVATSSTAVTWCFDLRNDGDVALANVTLDVTGLDIDETQMGVVGGGPVADALELVPAGADVHLFYESEVSASVLAVATASGVPTDQAGDPVPGADPAVAEDGSEIALAGVTVEKTVYAGHDAGAGCPGDEQVAGELDDEITYCFTVTDSGDTTLAPVTLADIDLGVTDADLTVLSGDLSSMAPGDEAVLYAESTVDGDLTNTATVEGTAVDDVGAPLVVEGGPITAVDTARVDEGLPAIELDKTVYEGHDEGASCPGDEIVKAVNDAAVTYCFSVTNSGDTTLAPVTLEDVDLGVTDADLTVLSGDLSSMAPGDEAVLYAESTVDGDLTNTATVEGTAVDDAGDPISGVDPVVLEDTAEVKEVAATVSLETDVFDPYTDAYLDADADEATAGSNDPQPATIAQGDTAEFRFTVVNDSEVDLAEVTVDAPQCDEPPTYADGDDGEPDLLEPEEQWHYTCTVADVQERLVLEATVDAAVAGEPDAAAPDGAGKAEFAEVQVAGVAIETSVQDPVSGTFGDTAVLTAGDDAVFQVVVHNVGDAPLDQLVVSDDQAPACSRTLDGVLEGGETLDPFTCTEPAIDGGFVNEASVIGVPVDDEGDQAADPVSADASAVVTTTAAAAPELSIDKSLATYDPAAQLATWQILVSNDGATAASEPIVVIDELPADLEFAQATGEGWVCQEVTAGVRCATDADVEPGSTTPLLAIETRVGAAPGSTVTNVAYVDGEDGALASDDAVLGVGMQSGDPTYMADQAPTGSLPRTGAVGVVGMIALGSLLVAAGSLLSSASRKR